MAATTARVDVVASLRTVLLARQTASPTLLRAVYSARPGSFPETPCAYIGNRDERIQFTAQTRTRTFAGLTVTIVDTLIDAVETEDRMDILIDLLVADFTTARNLVGGGGKLQITSTSDAEVVLTGDTGAVTYRGCVIGFGDPANPTFIMEGTA
ncbi:MAG: hypothetical protein ABI678_05050 [Kofleriaceae bacterium]